MRANELPDALAQGSHGNGVTMVHGLPAEVRSILTEWTFLLGRAADALWLGSQGLNAVDWARSDLGAAIRGRKLILIVSDAEES
jgi:hypothetical protein